jgi:hypothetical protein
MIDLTRTRADLLLEIRASAGAPANRLTDPADPRFVSLDEASLTVEGRTPGELSGMLGPAISRRFAHVPAERLFDDLLYLLKKGLGNAHKWGNRQDPIKRIVVETVVTSFGAVVAISDGGDGFDPGRVLGQLRGGESYYTHGGSGFKHFQRAKSLVSYADGGRTLLVCFACAPGGEARDAGAREIPAPGSSSAASMMPPSIGSDLSKRRNLMKKNGRKTLVKVRVVSYPKSGRTWLRTLVGKALCDNFGLDEGLILGKFSGNEAPGLPALSYTHDGCGYSKHRHYTEIATDKSEYKKKKVILLVRDPRDVLVSFYLHLSRRSDLYRGSLSEFVRDDHYGIRKIIAFYNAWYANLDVPRETLVLRYEQMHADPEGNLRAALAFIGTREIPDATIKQAVEFASFGNMKKLEGTHYFSNKKLRPGNAADAESWKVRRGVVGGYAEYLNDEDCRYVEDALRENPCPLFLQ